MDFAIISRTEVEEISIRTLGLDPELHLLEYSESLAASIRRTASFLCPTTPRVLIDGVLEVLTPVLKESPKRDDLMELLDQLISVGDLLELTESGSSRKARLLYLGPPSFVEREPGNYLVTGIRPLAAPLVSERFEVNHVLHTRTVALDPEAAGRELRAAGLHRIVQGVWVGQPSAHSAEEFLGQFQAQLGTARAAGAVDGLQIIDPGTKPRYYRGRWRAVAVSDTGDFVGRRPQAYGADLWCVVRLKAGDPERLIDLPLHSALAPGRDDAWRLQAAIDATNGTPLGYRVRSIPNMPQSESVVDFFSPLPTWAERYIELVGAPIDKSQGALFSYRVADTALTGLRSLLSDLLWMNILTD